MCVNWLNEVSWVFAGFHSLQAKAISRGAVFSHRGASMEVHRGERCNIDVQDVQDCWKEFILLILTIHVIKLSRDVSANSTTSGRVERTPRNDRLSRLTADVLPLVKPDVQISRIRLSIER